MDNYSLEEVKMLINKNLITPDIFNNILKSTTRRLDLYDDPDDLAILKYLSQSELVPEDAKKEIDKYLSIYNDYNNVSIEKNEIITKQRRKSVKIVLSIMFALIVICLLIILFKG